ncbi:DNA-binding response regulator, NarL/FixJ family, contains REC and HTH domains [Catalinimonas alkaloidigena]|uniref:DNA-binding response regulator, NarL/FixJ family, contains REC and HTH domains n=1 Tax=Catalinimonas alkaloidigena TaxID=1075417 RepID=A0A1G9R5Z2_9BACT|nr:response regulator transcription factor [Catalinimonas alkaloidigena]SDM18664.1 DNA-binding response regulator, NarL/FixJ family, contains REC and HTH domains [Catalinimonas alkaloidigena]
MNPINVILADDHSLVRTGIRSLLESEGDIKVVAEAANGQQALEMARDYRPDLLIVDIRMPELNGLEATRRLPEYSPRTRVLVLSMHDDDEYILQSVDNGAHGYLLKGSSREEFLKAVRTVHSGGKYFSGDISRVFVNRYLNHRQDGPAAADTAPSSHTESTPSGNDYTLTKREREILRLITEGLPNKEIAAQFGKSVRTIETHRFNIMKKLEVSNVVELLKKIEEEPSLQQALHA